MEQRSVSRPGLDSLIATALADFPGALAGLERILDRTYSPQDVMGRAGAVARLSEVIAFVTLSEEYDREVARLQERSLPQAIAPIKSRYQRLGREIKTLYEHIPYDEIQEAAGAQLNSILLTDGIEKLAVLKRYLGLGTDEGSESHVRRVIETLSEILNGSAVRVTTAATLYTEAGVLRGLVHHLEGERLSDLLNGVSDTASDRRSPFLEFSDAVNWNPARKSDTLPAARIMRQSIQLVTLSDGNAARGAGAREGVRSSSFIPKKRMPVELRTAEYSLVGNIHCRTGQSPEDALNDSVGFLSLTDVSVSPINECFEFFIPYAAVNKGRIQAVVEASISPVLSGAGAI